MIIIPRLLIFFFSYKFIEQFINLFCIILSAQNGTKYYKTTSHSLLSTSSFFLVFMSDIFNSAPLAWVHVSKFLFRAFPYFLRHFSIFFLLSAIFSTSTTLFIYFLTKFNIIFNYLMYEFKVAWCSLFSDQLVTAVEVCSSKFNCVCVRFMLTQHTHHSPLFYKHMNKFKQLLNFFFLQNKIKTLANSLF